MTLNTANLQKHQAQAQELLAAGFATKVAQKAAREAACRAYSELKGAVQGVYLALPRQERTQEQSDLYFDFPLYPHEWRAKHVVAIRTALPAAAKYIPAIEEIVALAASIKAQPIVAKVKVERAPQAGGRIQYRGHCQCCGRVHAVADGYVAQHGYKVKFNQFMGVCTGHMHNAMEIDRTGADSYVASWREAADHAEKRAAALKSGEVFPATAPVSNACRAEQVAFADAPAAMQTQAVRTEIAKCESQARGLRAHADAMERLANEVHGKPLQQVVIPASK